jgi:ABC-type polysaccharide/polyol phosphate export permease
MKKVSIICVFSSFGLLLLWMICMLIWACFNGFPKQIPHIWNILAAIPTLILLISILVFFISIRSLVISEIKQLLKQLN